MFDSILVIGVASFLLCALVHVLLWRIRRPLNDAGTLFMIFIIVPTILSLVLSLMALSVSFTSLFAWWLLHFSLSGAYIATYPIAQAVSPSLDILYKVGQSADGLDKETLLKSYNDTQLVGDRLQDLLNSKMIIRQGSQFTLSRHGQRIIRFFVFYRKILGLQFDEIG